MNLNTPKEVSWVAETLIASGFQAYLVGGCVRDILIGREPKDWDITTNAVPNEILELFPDSTYENAFGTVLVKIRNPKFENLNTLVEVTTFRKEGKYTDKRHPDEITFAKTIEEDLSRRDFTVNAMALNLKSEARSTKSETISNFEFRISHLVDPYGGQEDLKKDLIRAVGESDGRFQEDALRLMRAVRFAAQLGFQIEKETAEAIAKNAALLEVIAKERIRDEFINIVMSDANNANEKGSSSTSSETKSFSGAARGVQMLEDFGLLKFVLPELQEGLGCAQNLHHIYDVWEHSLRALDYAVLKHYSLEIRLASLLHDVGKPRTKRGEGKHATFHGHEIVGARMAKKILERLKFSNEITEKVVHLVRYHMFFYNTGEVSPAGVRRFLARVGVENIDALLQVREADRIGSGVPKARPYKIRHLLFMIDKVRRDPISPKMLKVNGEDVMKVLEIQPGPKVGWILSALMDEVLENPEENRIQNLESRIKELGRLSDDELRELAKRGREKIEGFEKNAEEGMKERHGV